MLHVLRFTPEGGSDMDITLFFDLETFQHVRTIHVHTVLPQLEAM